MERGQWMDASNDYSPNWQEQRKRVRARDQYRCSVCGLPEPEANRLDNLQLLCRRCHRRVEATVRTRGALDGLAYTLHHLHHSIS